MVLSAACRRGALRAARRSERGVSDVSGVRDLCAAPSLESWFSVNAAGDGRFTGSGWTPPGARGIYGGSLVSQSMAAATQSMTDERFQIHSLHAHFLRPGDGERHVEYAVENVRDGASFAARHVRASQGGKAVFHASFSFHARDDEGGICVDAREGGARLTPSGRLVLGHAGTEVPAPEEVPTMEATIEARAARSTDAAERARLDRLAAAFAAFPFDFRRADFELGQPTASRVLWIRSRHALGGLGMQQLALSFVTPSGIRRALGRRPSSRVARASIVCAPLPWRQASDWNLASTALLPRGIVFPHRRVARLASLDHSMWFHREAPAFNGWVCHHVVPHSLGHSRGFCTSRMFTARDELLLSCAQEALVRLDDEAETAR